VHMLRTQSSFRILLWAGLQGVWGVNGAAQVRPVELHGSSCAACSIQLTRIISLSDSMVAGLFAFEPLVARDSSGRWFVTSHLQGIKQIGVFNAAGHLIAALGREGKGPGEFSLTKLLTVAPNDSLYVYDTALLRRTVFGPDLKHARDDAVPGMMQAVAPLSGGKSIINANIATPDRVGFPLHLVGENGEIIRSFGAANSIYKPGDEPLMVRRLTVDDTENLWAALPNEYTITRYDSFGRVTASLTRRVAWLTPWVVPYRYPERPNPSLTAIRFDHESGLLWAQILANDPTWQPPAAPPKATQEYRDRTYDTVLEVIDVRTHSVLATRRFPQFMEPFAASRRGVLIPAFRVDSADRVWLDIYEATLARR